MVNTGCILLKEGQYDVARQKFNDAMGIIGYQVGAAGGGLSEGTSRRQGPGCALDNL